MVEVLLLITNSASTQSRRVSDFFRQPENMVQNLLFLRVWMVALITKYLHFKHLRPISYSNSSRKIKWYTLNAHWLYCPLELPSTEYNALITFIAITPLIRERSLHRSTSMRRIALRLNQKKKSLLASKNDFTFPRLRDFLAGTT